MSRVIIAIILIVFFAGCHTRTQTTQSPVARITVATYHWVLSNVIDPRKVPSYYHHARANVELGFLRIVTIDSNGAGLITDFSRDSDSHASFRFTLAEPSDTLLQRLGAFVPDTSYGEKRYPSDEWPKCMLIQRKDGSFTLISYKDPNTLPSLLRSIDQLPGSVQQDSLQADIPFDQVRHITSLIVARDESRLPTWTTGAPIGPPDHDTLVDHE